MLIKKRQLPLRIRKIEALLRRIPELHPKWGLIKEDLAKNKAGFRGEKSIDYYLSFIADENYYILHDLRLKDPKDRFFQMDTLIVTPRFILILEVKNFAGTLFFDSTFDQMIRTVNGHEESFSDPFSQVERQHYQLELWLRNKKLPDIPIVPLIVISSKKTLLKTNIADEIITQKVIRASSLPAKIKKISNSYPKVVPLNALNKVITLLKSDNTIQNPNIMEKHQIKKSDILTGVFCPACCSFPLIINTGKWHCFKCNRHSIDAHFPAINDYALLINNSINVKEFEQFLQIHSRSVSSKLLISLNLPNTGARKNRTYFLPPPE